MAFSYTLRYGQSMYFAAIGLVVVSTLGYHFIQKSTPESVNPWATLTLTYLVALVISIVALLVFPSEGGVREKFHDLGWPSVALGVAIVGIEAGFLLAYRAGWHVSTAALISHVALALILVPMGVLFFKEPISLRIGAGLVLALTGILLMINRD